MIPNRHDPIPDVRKIAVLRANAIGDLIFALPALDSLRAAYPDAEIVYLGRRWHADFLNGRPGPVDRALAVPPSRGVNGLEDVDDDSAKLDLFFQEMREEGFDIALQMHGGGQHSNPFVRRLGARLTVGLKAPESPPLDRWLPYVYFQPEIIRYLEVAALAGAAPVTLEPRLTVTERDLAESREVTPDDGRPLVVLHPGAGDPRRRWPTENFAAVGDALAAAGARVLVIGARDEHELDRRVVDGMRAPADNLCCRLSLGGLAGLLSRCTLVVSNDSGPLHLAYAVGAATVGVYWCFNLANSSILTRARHRPLSSWRLDCPVCGTSCVRSKCDHASSFVADVPVGDVTAAALELFAEEMGRRADA